MVGQRPDSPVRRARWTHAPKESLPTLAGTAIVLVALHAIQIGIWAITYKVLVPEGELPSFEAAAYFSFVTFTTLGYGDITLSEGWRLLSGIQALNGILLVGWSTAVLFAVVQRIWQGFWTRVPPNSSKNNNKQERAR